MPFCSFSKDSAMFDSTSIENMFLLEYLPTAPEGFLRVYLYARMLSLHPELCDSIEDMAKALHMEEDAVYNAFHYWEQQGLVEKLTDRPATYAMRPVQKELISNSNINEDLYKYKDYYSKLQEVFGEKVLLSPRHYEKANDWINVMGFSQEAALQILKYEFLNPGGRMPDAVFKRADKRALEWAERGIHTLKEVEEAIAYNDQVYSMASAVLKQLAISRKPTANELDCVRRWISDWKLSIDDVLSACADTTKARSPSIAYLDAILKSKVDMGNNQYFEPLKEVLRTLGASNIIPNQDQLHAYSSFLDDGFEPEVVMMAAAQCANKGQHTFDKLKWRIDDWRSSAVRTQDQAQAYLSNKQKIKEELRALYKASGLVRKLYPNDITLYESWKQKYDDSLILCAAECSSNAKEPTKYMNKLLTEWEKAGITTPEAAKAQHAAYKGAYTAGAATPNHMNYQQRPTTDDTYGKNSYSDPTKDLE